MNLKFDLKWSDLVSPTMTPDEYLKIYGDKIKRVYESYEPKSDTLNDIKNLLKNKKEKLKIIALGADWCPDCSRNVPRMIKIVKFLNTEEVGLQILYGIMVNALHKPGETIWHKNRSPPEANDPKFDLKAIPSFYFFNDAGEYLGIIVENPDYTSTLEEDILKILKRSI
ncbi:MAG: thioredoxin family protein [Candidatus Lokiarchaeota archaeon]|nr:thioredoxin family protein [Candidatus Lokiarchaeota archaeon]MCK4480527.1 thioredoxin family protein [Candidatus Lokiarchaeota archaeon]